MLARRRHVPALGRREPEPVAGRRGTVLSSVAEIPKREQRGGEPRNQDQNHGPGRERPTSTTSIREGADLAERSGSLLLLLELVEAAITYGRVTSMAHMTSATIAVPAEIGHPHWDRRRARGVPSAPAQRTKAGTRWTALFA